MARVSQVMAPAMRNRQDISMIKGNDGYFYLDAELNDFVYWGFPVQVEQNRVIDAIEVEIYGGEIEAGGYIASAYYFGGEVAVVETHPSPFGTPGQWTTVKFTKNDIWQTDEARTYWVIVKSKPTRKEEFRIRGINVVY